MFCWYKKSAINSRKVVNVYSSRPLFYQRKVLYFDDRSFKKSFQIFLVYISNWLVGCGGDNNVPIYKSPERWPSWVLILTASLCRYLIILLARHEAGCVPLFSSLASLFSRICKLPVQFQNGFDTVRMKSNRKPKIFNYLKYPANITSQFDSSLTCTIRCERRSFEEKLLCWVCTIVQNCNTRVIYVDIKRYMENTDLRWKEKQSASQPYQKYRPLWKTKLHFHHL